MCPDVHEAQREAEELYEMTVQHLMAVNPERRPDEPLADGSPPLPFTGRTFQLSLSEMTALEQLLSWAIRSWNSSDRPPGLAQLLSYAQSTGTGPEGFTITCYCLCQMMSLSCLLGSGEYALATITHQDFAPGKVHTGTVPSTLLKRESTPQSGISSAPSGPEKIPIPPPEDKVGTKSTANKSKKGRSRKARASTKRGSASRGKEKVVDGK